MVSDGGNRMGSRRRVVRGFGIMCGMKGKRLLASCAVGVLLAAGGLVFWLSSSEPAAVEKDAQTPAKKSRISTVDAASRPKTPRQKRIASMKKKQTKKPAVAGKARPAVAAVEADVELSEADQKQLDVIQDALDEENFVEVRRLAEKLIDHPSPEVRQRAVEALQWFGAKALESLTPFLADSSEDVREEAMSAVEQALSEMESESAKIAYIESLFQIKGACDEDGLTMLSGELLGLDDSAAVVDAAVRVITANSNPAAVAEMRDVYEFVTDEPYTTPEAAQQWRAEHAGDGNE